MKKLFKLILNSFPRPILIRLSYVARPILAFLLKGTTFTDPIDGKSFKMFLPYGYGNQRNNVLSPSSLSLERHRLLWLYLINETDFFTSSEKKKVLHFAPEQAFYKLSWTPAGFFHSDWLFRLCLLAAHTFFSSVINNCCFRSQSTPKLLLKGPLKQCSS